MSRDIHRPTHEAIKAQVERLIGGRLGSNCLVPHSHQCANCGLVWAHDPYTVQDSHSAFDASHTCADCGQTQTRVYRGSDVPTCVNNGISCIKVK